MKRNLLIFAWLSFTVVSAVSHADIDGKDLPSMGNLAKLLGTVDPTVVEESVYNEQGKISAGMPAPDDARGNTSAEIAKLLGEGNSEQEKNLVVALNDTRVKVEDYLIKAGFDVSDIGVSMALSFITLWELASDVELSEEASLTAGKNLVHNFGGAKSSFTDLELQDKAKLHDYLMTTPIAFAALVETFEEQGGAEQVTMLRTKSADLFKEVFLLSHDMFIFEEDGSFNINEEALEKYQEENSISSDW